MLYVAALMIRNLNNPKSELGDLAHAIAQMSEMSIDPTFAATTRGAPPQK